MKISVQPSWSLNLPIQQQSVLFLAGRGPDGIPKYHPCKHVQRAYRGTVLTAAAFGRPLAYGEEGDSFMCLKTFGDLGAWNRVVDDFFLTIDELPHHFIMHLIHAAEIIGYKHPDVRFRFRWEGFYQRACVDMHVRPETDEEMDLRLCDWDQKRFDLAEMDGAELVAMERRRQIFGEGYDDKYDDAHLNGELPDAAVAYITGNTGFWSKDLASFKRDDDQIRNLTKAGAVICAEIDRLQRMAKRQKAEDETFSGILKGDKI